MALTKYVSISSLQTVSGPVTIGASGKGSIITFMFCVAPEHPNGVVSTTVIEANPTVFQFIKTLSCPCPITITPPTTFQL